MYWVISSNLLWIFFQLPGHPSIWQNKACYWCFPCFSHFCLGNQYICAPPNYLKNPVTLWILRQCLLLCLLPGLRHSCPQQKWEPLATISLKSCGTTPPSWGIGSWLIFQILRTNLIISLVQKITSFQGWVWCTTQKITPVINMP